MGTKEQRIELLKGMNQYIIDLGDELAYDAWFSMGVPDEATDDDYEFIAEDLDHWVFVCNIFGAIIKEFEEQRERVLVTREAAGRPIILT